MKAWVLTVGIIAGFFYLLFASDWSHELRRAQAEQAASDAKPHVIRAADGCLVYAFKAEGRFHYFTRCEDSKTVTETTWDECSMVGKIRNCKPMSETIGDGQ